MVVGGIPVEVVRKDIKHLHLGVYPPGGRVRVAVPSHVGDQNVRLAVVSRLGWINRQRRRFQRQPRQMRREMVTGESHYLWGRRLRLVVTATRGKSNVLASGRRLILEVPSGANRSRRQAIMDAWYRKELKSALARPLETWQRRISTDAFEVRIRRMRTRWGSCMPDSSRIWLNLELAKKDPACLEYVLVHEMAHLLERRHNERFEAIMDQYMPTWRRRRCQLDEGPLPYANWPH